MRIGQLAKRIDINPNNGFHESYVVPSAQRVTSSGRFATDYGDVRSGESLKNMSSFAESARTAARNVARWFSDLYNDIKRFVSNAIREFARMPTHRSSPSKLEEDAEATVRGINRSFRALDIRIPDLNFGAINSFSGPRVALAGAAAASASPALTVGEMNFYVRTLWDPKDPTSKRGVIEEIRQGILGLERESS